MAPRPPPIPINETYTSVQTGVVDGVEHDPGTVLAYKWDEVVKHCLLTRHVYTPMLAYIGKRGLAKIPDDLKADFQEAAVAATAACRADVPNVEAEAVAQLRAKGITFKEMIPAERTDLRARMAAELYPAFLKQYPDTAPLFAKIQATRDRSLNDPAHRGASLGGRNEAQSGLACARRAGRCGAAGR